MRSILVITFWDVQHSRLRRGRSVYLFCIRIWLSLVMRGRPFDGPFQPPPILNVACDRRRTKAVAASVCADSSMLAPPALGNWCPRERMSVLSFARKRTKALQPRTGPRTCLGRTSNINLRRRTNYRTQASPGDPNRLAIFGLASSAVSAHREKPAVPCLSAPTIS